jgi:hypothetical protein
MALYLASGSESDDDSDEIDASKASRTLFDLCFDEDDDDDDDDDLLLFLLSLLPDFLSCFERFLSDVSDLYFLWLFLCLFLLRPVDLKSFLDLFL